MIVRFIWFTLCLLRYFTFARTLTTSDVNTISNKIISTFKITPQYGILCNDKVTPCPLGNLFGGILRLVFHDASGNGQ